MLDDGFAEDFIEFGSFDFEMASGIDFGGELEEFSNVLAGLGACNEDGSVREEVEIAFEFVEDVVGVGDKVGFGEDDDDAFASFDDLAGKGLVEFGMGLSGVNEEGTDVGLFDGGESAKGGKLFDADFALAGFTETSGVKNLESAAVVADFDAVDVAGGALAGRNESLLFLAEGVEE